MANQALQQQEAAGGARAVQVSSIAYVALTCLSNQSNQTLTSGARAVQVSSITHVRAVQVSSITHVALDNHYLSIQSIQSNTHYLINSFLSPLTYLSFPHLTFSYLTLPFLTRRRAVALRRRRPCSRR
jgi:hypothetical protein